MIVDLILSSTFEGVDLDEDPCIVPSCGHILTLESMDGHMSMSDFYVISRIVRYRVIFHYLMIHDWPSILFDVV